MVPFVFSLPLPLLTKERTGMSGSVTLDVAL